MSRVHSLTTHDGAIASLYSSTRSPTPKAGTAGTARRDFALYCWGDPHDGLDPTWELPVGVKTVAQAGIRPPRVVSRMTGAERVRCLPYFLAVECPRSTAAKGSMPYSVVRL